MFLSGLLVESDRQLQQLLANRYHFRKVEQLALTVDSEAVVDCSADLPRILLGYDPLTPRLRGVLPFNAFQIGIASSSIVLIASANSGAMMGAWRGMIPI